MNHVCTSARRRGSVKRLKYIRASVIAIKSSIFLRRALKKNRSTEPGVVSDSSFRSFFKKSNVIGGIALK